jgi:hypothetical protein
MECVFLEHCEKFGAVPGECRLSLLWGLWLVAGGGVVEWWSGGAGCREQEGA